MTEVKRSSQSTQESESHPKSRRVLLQFLIICLPLWLSFKFYSGPYHDQVGNYLAGVLFLIIWALVIQLFQPSLREVPLLIVLFLLLSAFELACWRYPELFENLSITLAGQTIFGELFSLNRIPYYGVGAFIGYFILKACRIK